MPADTAELDADLVLDQLVDECHQIHAWLRDVLDGARDLDPHDLDHVMNPAMDPALNPSKAAWIILTSLLARDVANLHIDVAQRLETRLSAPMAHASAADHEVAGADLLCRMFAIAAVRSAADNGDEDDGPALAQTMIDDLHERLRTAIGCIEWLSGLREGKLARRNIIRDGRLADRAHREAMRLIGDL